jgi:hypothetical protein
MTMKSKITILTVTLACLSQGANSVRAQLPYPGRTLPQTAPAGVPVYGHVVPVQYQLPAAAPANLAGQAGPVQPRLGQPLYGQPVYGQPFAVPAAPGFDPSQAAAQRFIYPQAAGAPPTVVQSRTATMPAATTAEAAIGTSVMSQPETSSVMPAPTGPLWSDYQSDSQGCSGCADCSSCDACGDCGMPDCSCACDSGLFSGLFHSGCLARLLQDGALHDGLFGYPRPVRVWGGVEGLWWWNKERNLPVLATTSVPGTPFAQAGVLGQPGTSVLFGGGEFDGEGSEGIRATLGLWLDRGQNYGVFTRAFQFGGEDINFHASSAGDPILARPFFDVGLGVQDALVVAFPGVSRGRIDIETSNEANGFDVLVRKLMYYGDCNRLDLICGYQYNEITDTVRVAHEIIATEPEGQVPVGTRLNTLDSFDADNEFYGGSIGLMAQGFDGRLTWNMLSKIAFGSNRQTVTIRGQSSTLIPGDGLASFNDGLLALGTNSGVYERDQFMFVPELDLSVMYNLCSMLSVSVGYTVMYWSDVVLAGDAIDTAINPTQIGGPLIGPALPTYSLVDDDFWLHGLTFGVHGRF